MSNTTTSVADEYTRIQTAKNNIKTAIINKGGSVSANALISDYATAIDNIPTSDGTTDYGLGVLIYEGTFANTTGTFSVTTLSNGESFSFDKIVVELSNVFQGQNVNKQTYWRSDEPMSGYDEPLILDSGSAYRYNVTYHATTTITIVDDTYIELFSKNYDENNPTSTVSTYQRKEHNGYDKITAYGWWSWNCPAEARIKIVGYKRKELTLIPKTITVNGTYIADNDNADGYSNVTVNTQGSGQWTTEGLVDGSEPSGVVDLGSATFVKSYAFYQNTAITEVISNNTEVVRNCAFSGCTSLTAIKFLKVTSFNQSAFDGCTSLYSVHAPLLETVGHGALAGNVCQTIFLPSLIQTQGYSFTNTKQLETAIFPMVTTLGANNKNTFKGASKLTVLVLGYNGVVNNTDINNFDGTPFASGGSGGEIYIPKTLYDHLGDGSNLDYLANNVWNTINGYGTITWRQIEGSEYETYMPNGEKYNEEMALLPTST